MNYNQFSIPNINTEWNESNHPLCKRAKLDTGTLCNLNCIFCYYKDRLDQMDSYDDIKKRVDYISSYSLISEIELSGGESSIHPDWFKILEYCSTKFDYISTLSHGQKFATKDFLIKSKEFGLKEILFSMHGTFGIHDSIVQKQGAYTKLIKAIHNAFDLDLRVRINCTVTMENYNNIQHNFVEEILKILNKYPLAQLNFIFYNYWDDNKTGEIIDYKILAEAVSNAIKQIKEKYSEFDIRLRYLPFCMIDTEFQPLIYGQFQHLFDTTDWNKEIYSGTKYFPKMNFTWDHSLRLGWEAARDSRLHSYYKPKECFKCKHYQWCDGLELPLKNHKVYPIYE